jgi:hypothetical protein
MKTIKKILLLFLVFCGTKSVSQIYFSPDAYMYVKNEVLYAKQDVNLAVNSNLYLRNHSQLVQGTTSVSTNTGLGKLSVYQEGTTDSYEYNYWCSPVGTPSSASGNENFGIKLLNRPTTSTAATPATMLPWGSQNGTANPLGISTRWIYKLVNANNYSQWIHVGETNGLAAGEGFTMKGTGGTDALNPEGTGITNNPGGAQRYDFRGKPNDGNITITLGTNNSTLTGNPYPSALHLNAFLLDGTNTATGGVAYFWEQDKTVNSHFLAAYKGGYGTFSPVSDVSNGLYVPATFNTYNGDGTVNHTGVSSGLAIERKYAPIGQGFVIFATANGTATFKNSHRVLYKEGGGLTQFQKISIKDTDVKDTDAKDTAKKENNKKESDEEESNPVSYLRLNTIIDNAFTRQLALALVPEATDGVDYGIDALNMDGSLPNDVTFWLEGSGYTIQGVNFEVSKKIPLMVKVTTEATFKFYIPEVKNFDQSQPIYLYDALDNTYHDIKNGFYQVTIAPGTYSDRFKITFTSESLGTPDNVAKQFVIYEDNSNSVLKASNPNNLTIQSFRLYDMLGKVVLSKKALGNDSDYAFSTSGLSYGIYIAEFLTIDNQKLIQKVFISNSGKN